MLAGAFPIFAARCRVKVAWRGALGTAAGTWCVAAWLPLLVAASGLVSCSGCAFRRACYNVDPSYPYRVGLLVPMHWCVRALPVAMEDGDQPVLAVVDCPVSGRQWASPHVLTAGAMLSRVVSESPLYGDEWVCRVVFVAPLNPWSSSQLYGSGVLTVVGGLSVDPWRGADLCGASVCPQLCRCWACGVVCGRWSVSAGGVLRLHLFVAVFSICRWRYV